MKKLIALLVLVSSFSALADCEILQPNKVDRNGKYCSGTSYGVTYNGYMASDACYSTLREALSTMKLMNACDRPATQGNCSILYSGRVDKNSRYCSGASFAVMYKGYIAEDNCFTSIDAAMKGMDSTLSCKKEDSLGHLSILYPGRVDKNSRYCSGMSFSVMYDGYLIEDACYSSIDKAMAVMESF